MKTKLSGILALILLVNSAIAQTFVAQVKEVGSKDWYYVNPGGEKIITVGYAKGYPFCSEGYAPVFNPVLKEFYFIDLKGESLITEVKGFRLMEMFGLDIKGFKDGMVAIKKGGRWGYLNKEGKLAVLLKYTYVTEFDNGFASVRKGKENFIINKKGDETPVSDPQILTISAFSEGLAAFRSPEKKMGFINTEGKIVIPFSFLSVGDFKNGLAWAKTMDKKVGFINKEGKWVIEPNYLSATDFESVSGLAKVKKESGNYAYVDQKGNLKEFSNTETYGNFSEGLAYGRKGGKVGFYDATGTWIIDAQFEAVRDFKNGYACAKMGKLWGLIDKKGNWVIKPVYAAIRDVEKVKN